MEAKLKASQSSLNIGIHMSYALNSLMGDYIGDYIGDSIGVT